MATVPQREVSTHQPIPINNPDDPNSVPPIIVTTPPLPRQSFVRSVSFDPNLVMDPVAEEKAPFLEEVPESEKGIEESELPSDHMGRLQVPSAFDGQSENGREQSVKNLDVKLRKISRKFSSVDPQDENQERGNWSNPFEFILSIMGYCIGLGNIWRFPVLCYTNGGGAFLIPYFTMLVGCGLPLIVMEMSLGQYSSEAVLTVWKFCPLFKGLGIGMVIVTIVCSIYYNMITAWSLYYFVISLRSKLPWECCEAPWQTDSCVSLNPERCGVNMTNYVHPDFGNGSKYKLAADNYFHNQILKLSEDVTDVGSVHWQSALALFFAWLIVFLVLCRGIKSLGKASYFTSTFPFIILLILLIRAAIEPGATTGMRYFLTPRWHLLKKAKIWSDAASQIFFTTGVCQGGAMTMASYNKFNANVFRNSAIMVFGNAIVSFFSGLVCFSILGFMAQSVNAEIDDVITSGPGLTFIIYPSAVTILPISPLWSALFFFMLTTLAFSSMFPTVEIVTTSVTDQVAKLRPYKYFVTMATCGAMFLLGLSLATHGGMYILEIMNTYGVGYALLLLGITELAVVSWIYGANRLAKNVAQMTGKATFLFWRVMWYAITPALLTFAIVFSIINFSKLAYDKYVYPDWVNWLGFCLMCVSLVPIPMFAVWKFVRYKMGPRGKDLTYWETLVELTTPTEDWGPALKRNRA